MLVTTTTTPHVTKSYSIGRVVANGPLPRRVHANRGIVAEYSIYARCTPYRADGGLAYRTFGHNSLALN